MATNKKIKFDIEGFDKANREVQDLTDKLGKLHSEFGKADASSDEFRKIQKEIAKTSAELDQAQKRVESFNKSKLDKVKGVVSGLRSGFGDLTHTIAGTNDSAGLLEGAFKRMGIENEYLSKAIEMMGAKGTKSMGLLRVAFASIGIGLLVAAVAGLVSYFTRTTEGSAKLSKALAYMGGIVDLMISGFASLGKWIVDTITNFDSVTAQIKKVGTDISDYFKKVAESPRILLDDMIGFFQKKLTILGKIWDAVKGGNFKDAANGVIELYTGVENGIDKASAAITEFGNKIDEAGRKGQRIQELEQNLIRVQRASVGVQASLQAQIEKLNQIADSDLKSAQERENAARRSAQLQKQLLGEKNRVLNAELNLISVQKTTNMDLDARNTLLKSEADLRAEIRSNAAEAGRIDLETSEKLYAAAKENADRVKDTLEAEYEKRKQSLETQLAEATSREEALAIQREILTEQEKYNSAAVKAYGTLADTSDRAAALLTLSNELIAAQNEYTAAVKNTNAEFDKRLDDAAVRSSAADLENFKLKAAEAGLKEQLGLQKFYLGQAKTAEEQSLEEWYGKEKSVRGRLPEELAALHKEYVNKKIKLDQDYAAQTTAIDEGAKEKAKARTEKLIEEYKAAYSTIADTIQSVADSLTSAAVGALDARLSELDSFIQEAQNNLGLLDSQAQETQASIDSLEDELLSAKGAARERIIQQLEQERQKQKQIAQERRAEDERIKKAERDKIKLEQDKEKALARQVLVQQSLQAVQAALVGIEAVRAGIEASKTVATTGSKGKFGWDNIALIIASTAALVTSFATMKNAAKGFADGGYTGDGGKYEEAGIVHRGEYVIPQWMVRKNTPLISTLERQRARGYAEGGMVGESIAQSTAPVSDPALIARLDTMNAMLTDNLAKPIYTVATEVAEVNARVAKIKESSLK